MKQRDRNLVKKKRPASATKSINNLTKKASYFKKAYEEEKKIKDE